MGEHSSATTAWTLTTEDTENTEQLLEIPVLLSSGIPREFSVSSVSSVANVRGQAPAKIAELCKSQPPPFLNQALRSSHYRVRAIPMSRSAARRRLFAARR